MDELMTYEDTSVPAIGDESLIQLAAQAEKRVDAMNKIKNIALKLTNSNDWVDENGKPFLQASGAEKVARMLGISWRIADPEIESLEGGHYQITYKGYFSVSGATIEVIGTRSSKDPFFKKYGYPDGKKTELPASEIDKGDVKKAALSNCIGNGVTRLIGIRNLTYEDLFEFAGIRREQMAKIEYKDKGKAKEEVREEGSFTIDTLVGEVKQRTKKKDGTPLKSPLFVLVCDGVEYTTFSKTYMETARAARDEGVPIVLTYTVNKFGQEVNAVSKKGAPEPEGEAA